MRHAVATLAISKGDDPARVAKFLGHRDARTTARFYATHAVPPKIRTFL
jgi:integrase